MQFRLTYEGRLDGNGSPKHKHEVRKFFHPQLKRLWQVEPNLKAMMKPTTEEERPERYRLPMPESWSAFQRFGYHFIPTAAVHDSLLVNLDILFLRPEPPGGLIKSADIDNRLKTLFDALRMPDSEAEVGGYARADDEEPFFVLLEDDKLLSKVSVETDILLAPTPTAANKFLPNDARLIITVHLRPYAVTMDNLHFA